MIVQKALKLGFSGFIHIFGIFVVNPMYYRLSAISRRIGLLEFPPPINHVICGIDHAVEFDFFTIFVHKFQLAAEVSPNVI